MENELEIQHMLIGGAWQPSRSAVGTFRPVDPSTKAELTYRYPVSGREDVNAAIKAGVEAAEALRVVSPRRIGRFLDRFAELIEVRRADLVAMAHLETGLPAEPRLNSVELPRTTMQLRQAAQAARDRSWTRPVIDTKLNIRAMFGPLGGPVVVFGPNNFPFAFNAVAGGDSAAALAAGNPVIAKANSGHPGTSRLLAALAMQAVQETGLPEATIQLLYQLRQEVGLELAANPAIGAVAFTGSKHAGMALKAAADRAGKPIYLEMSSINPVFIFPGALEERLDSVAEEFFASCTLGAGQFCTKPGLVILPSGALGEAFLAAAAKRFADAHPGVLLGAGGPAGIAEGLQVLTNHGAVVVAGGAALDGPSYCFQNTLLRVSGEDFLQSAESLQTEAFGPVSLLVLANGSRQICEIARCLEGSLTGTIYSHTGSTDETLYAQLEPILRKKVGRLLNDKMPTGVALSPAMNHGGPYPATGHPGFTAVGIPSSIARFAALYSYDNVRLGRLPFELRDENPDQIWRLIDGVWSQQGVEAVA